MKIFIDLETIQSQQVRIINRLLANVKIQPPANYKKQETIDKWIEDNTQRIMDEAISKTVFNGSYGEIVTVGYAVDDMPVHSLQRNADLDEHEILQRFFDHLNMFCHEKNRIIDFTWVAHNADFDLPYLKKRCIINEVDTYGITIPTGRYDKRIYCTMQQWAGFGNRISMDDLAFILGIAGKQGMTGADVYPAWQAGEYEKIAEYCRHDVTVLREIYGRIA